MESIKKTDSYTIYKKRSGRYGVMGANQKWINGADKTKILLEAKLIKAAPKKKEAPKAEAAASESSEAPKA